jgi:hypothetical protein
MKEQDGLRGSGRRSVIPYVHGRMKVVVLLCVLFNSRVELALKSLRELV